MKHGAILNYNCYRILNTTKFELRIIGRFIKDITNYNLCFLHRTNTNLPHFSDKTSKKVAVNRLIRIFFLLFRVALCRFSVYGDISDTVRERIELSCRRQYSMSSNTQSDLREIVFFSFCVACAV
jgi:hypothetical protein